MSARRHEHEVIRLEAKKKVPRWNVEALNFQANEIDVETTSEGDQPLLLK